MPGHRAQGVVGAASESAGTSSVAVTPRRRSWRSRYVVAVDRRRRRCAGLSPWFITVNADRCIGRHLDRRRLDREVGEHHLDTVGPPPRPRAPDCAASTAPIHRCTQRESRASAMPLRRWPCSPDRRMPDSFASWFVPTSRGYLLAESRRSALVARGPTARVGRDLRPVAALRMRRILDPCSLDTSSRSRWTLPASRPRSPRSPVVAADARDRGDRARGRPPRRGRVRPQVRVRRVVRIELGEAVRAPDEDGGADAVGADRRRGALPRRSTPIWRSPRSRPGDASSR